MSPDRWGRQYRRAGVCWEMWKTAIVEMASASGLYHVPPECKISMLTTSYGTGELDLCRTDHGVGANYSRDYGSATNDGGAGMLQALGVAMLIQTGNRFFLSAAARYNLALIDASGCDARLKNVSVTVACDVNNPLCGATGASAIFGPQKGSNTRNGCLLRSCADQLRYTTSQDATGRNVMTTPGGAAGGMGGAVRDSECGVKAGSGDCY